MSAKTIADNGWVKLAERVAVVVLAGGIAYAGKLLIDLNTQMAEITAVQDRVVVPGLTEVKDDLRLLTDNLLNQPRFDKNDGQRLDDAHRAIMQGLDARLRELEARDGWPQ